MMSRKLAGSGTSARIDDPGLMAAFAHHSWFAPANSHDSRGRRRAACSSDGTTLLAETIGITSSAASAPLVQRRENLPEHD